MTLVAPHRARLSKPYRAESYTAAGAMLCTALLAGCASPERAPYSADAGRTEMRRAMASLSQPVPPGVSDALLAPAPAAAPAAPPEPRLDLIFNRANARDVFLALVVDTPLSITVHPDINGSLSMTLRRVTLREALDAIRDMYGYDWRIDGNRISVFPPAPQTRVYPVNYLTLQRVGTSEISVSSGGLTEVGPSSTSGGSSSGTSSGNSGSTTQRSGAQSTQLATTSRSDLWTELTAAIRAIVGTAPGRQVLVTPQAGIVTVRAMPDELRQVEAYLQSVRGAVERQVMLEAKIIDIELNDGFQSGVDWTRINSFNGYNVGVGNSGGGIGGLLNSAAQTALGLRGLPSASSSTLPGSLGLPTAGGGAFGLSIGSTRFEAVLSFLETFGDTQVLSSPRIATLNNQRALLKVGSDEYYITGVTGGSNTVGGTTTTSSTPSVTLTPFFSGIALDVMPQIDDTNNVILHVHPSISTVAERSREIDLGTAGTLRLPLASSNINQSDTIVRVQDGNIVAIGGLMQVDASNGMSGLPGASGSGIFKNVLGNQRRTNRKRELVILIKPTIIRSTDDWARTTREAQVRIDVLEGQMRDAPTRVIRIPDDAAAAPATPGAGKP